MPAPELGQSAHDLAMIAKVDNASATVAEAAAGKPMLPPADTPKAPEATPPASPAAAVRPEHIPEKFWDATKGVVNVDAMAKSYVELEKGKSQAPAATDPPKEGDPPAAPTGPAAKLDFAAMANEVQAGGKLSDDSIKALEATGIDRKMAEEYIAGQQALAELRDAKGFLAAGGEQAFQSMAQWAGANYSEAEQTAFNKAVSTGTIAEMQAAVTALKARYEASVGKDPVLSHGQGGNSGGAQPFASQAEITAAMRDPRYRSDPAYRKSIEQRLDATDPGNVSI